MQIKNVALCWNGKISGIGWKIQKQMNAVMHTFNIRQSRHHRHCTVNPAGAFG